MKFDIVILLNTKAVPNKFQSLDFPDNIHIKHSLYSAEHAERDDGKHAMPITDFHPSLHYLNALKRAYRNVALFFYDEFGGRQIGVLLRPEALRTKPFKQSSVECSMLTNTSYSHSIDNVTLNLDALCEDFAILGDGLVHKVQLQTS